MYIFRGPWVRLAFANQVSSCKPSLNKVSVQYNSSNFVTVDFPFLSYAMYYEHLLRHQHQLLYTKEQVRPAFDDELSISRI